MRNNFSSTYYCALLSTFYVLTFALSNLDGYLTLFCLETGFCEEKNPLMRWAIGVSPQFFLIFKSLLVGGFGGVLMLIGWRFRKKSILFLFGLIFLCYLWIIHYHFTNINKI